MAAFVFKLIFVWLPNTASFLFLSLCCPETVSPCQWFGSACRAKPSCQSCRQSFKWLPTSVGGQRQGSVVAEHFPYLEVAPDGLQGSEHPVLGHWVAPRRRAEDTAMQADRKLIVHQQVYLSWRNMEEERNDSKTELWTLRSWEQELIVLWKLNSLLAINAGNSSWRWSHAWDCWSRWSTCITHIG